MLSPLRTRVFAVIFLTSLATQLAIFMNGLGGAWVLTDLPDSPAVISLLQMAVAAPTFLLALVAGALADVMSRKRIIVIAQAATVLVAGAFAALSFAGAHTLVTVIGLTAALGGLTALAAPAWLAVIPSVVRPAELPAAMTLSSAGVSIAMAVGPALGGVVIAALGPTWVFILNAVVVGAGLFALRSWRPEDQRGLPTEHLGAAVRRGLQYVRHDRPLRVVIGKVVPFALVVVALPSLLPAVARFRLDAGPALFGLLSAMGGIGAVVGLALVPWMRGHLSPDATVFAAIVTEGAAFALLASTTSVPLALAALTLAGLATLALIATVMTTLQEVLPGWIRGRGIAVYLLALQGSFTVGAFAWGAIAQATSLQAALMVAAGAMAVAAVLAVPLRLATLPRSGGVVADLGWEPTTSTSVLGDDGPILVSAQWTIDPSRRDGFLTAMAAVRTSLRRQGALSWHLAEDVEAPGQFVEAFTMATWTEYTQLPSRATERDLGIFEDLVEAAGTQAPPLEARLVVG